ncbi:MAG: serine/threonine-protein phosphatase [Clostridiales bacterium]|nr:serine/threonine-protein phosphatase [Clostridiales bacterium]
MLMDKDEYLVIDANQYMRVCLFSTRGDRDEQQDCSGLLVDQEDGIVVICDGMGGHRGGRDASNTAVRVVLNAFSGGDFTENIEETFRSVIADADYEISQNWDENGDPLRSGTTIVSVLVKKKNVFWVSAGDSRIYLMRGEEMIQITKDHTYELALKENLEAGMISRAFFENQKPSAGALISFLGIGGIPLIDSNHEPFRLLSGDKIILMSDGLYKYLPMEMVKSIISGYVKSEDAVRILNEQTLMAAHARGLKRDNMTVAIVDII